MVLSIFFPRASRTFLEEAVVTASRHTVHDTKLFKVIMHSRAPGSVMYFMITNKFFQKYPPCFAKLIHFFFNCEDSSCHCHS